MRNRHIFSAAIGHWGIEKQQDIAKGEMGECVAAMTRYFTQRRGDENDVIDEIADVKVVMNQMEIYFDGLVGRDSVKRRYQEKVERLASKFGMQVEKTVPEFDVSTAWFAGFPVTQREVLIELQADNSDVKLWVPGFFIGTNQKGDLGFVETEDNQIHCVSSERIKAANQEQAVDEKLDSMVEEVSKAVSASGEVHLRDYQKRKLEADENKKSVGEAIVEKYPEAMPMIDFMYEHQQMLPGTVIVNHENIDPLVLTDEMIAANNYQVFNWFNMLNWFVIKAPQWEDHDKSLEREYFMDEACALIARHGNNLLELTERLYDLGFQLPRKDLGKETELNLIFADMELRARDGGREVANKLYKLGYRKPVNKHQLEEMEVND